MLRRKNVPSPTKFKLDKGWSTMTGITDMRRDVKGNNHDMRITR